LIANSDQPSVIGPVSKLTGHPCRSDAAGGEVERLLGDLELGADGDFPVVSSLPASDPVSLLARRQRREANEALHQQVSEIKRLGQIDPRVADAALQRMVRDRGAREALSPIVFHSDADLQADLEILSEDAAGSLGQALPSVNDRARPTDTVPHLKPSDNGIAHTPASRVELEATEAKLGTPVSPLTAIVKKPEAIDHAIQLPTPLPLMGQAASTLAVDSIEELLGDLEIGLKTLAEESEDQNELGGVVEELMASKSGPPEIARGATVQADYGELKASSAFVVTDKKRREHLELIKHTRIKYGRGKTVVSDDPLAEDKAKVTNFLKGFGLTPDALPFDFWSQPDESVRSLLLGYVVQPVREKRAFEKTVAKSIKAGYPADYYSRPDGEQRRISNAVRQRRFNAKKPASGTSVEKKLLPTTAITLDWGIDSRSRLMRWTAGADATAIQFRGRENDLVKARANFKRLINILGREPTQTELAAALNCSRRTAQTRIKRIREFEAAGGPWYDGR
jgi:hypothetical protein